MTILTKREVWTKLQPANETRRSSDLTLAEQENVRVALRFLHTRLGGWRQVAEAMKAHRPTLRDRMYGRTVTGGLALRVARLAVVSGVASDAISASRFRPSGLPFSASNRRSASVNRRRLGPRCARSTRFSARNTLDGLGLVATQPA
jgi:hypothetical protein